MGYKILIVIAAILLAILGLALTRLRFRIAYVDGFVATLRIWFIKFNFFPAKAPKPPEPGDFEINRFKRRLNKRIKKARKKEEKKLKKAREEQTETKSEGKPKARDPKALIDMLIEVLKILFDKFPRYLKTNMARLVIGVATEDAATTAVTYGAVVQSTQYVIAMLKKYAGLRADKDAYISVYPDFTCDKWKAEIDITLSIRVWQVISLGISLMLWYFRRKSTAKTAASDNNDNENSRNTEAV